MVRNNQTDFETIVVLAIITLTPVAAFGLALLLHPVVHG